MDKEGWRLLVKHLLSLEGFCHGLTDCLDMELVQFVLEGIHDGVWLGSLDGAIDADPWQCRNGHAVKDRLAELHAVMQDEVARGCRLGHLLCHLLNSSSVHPSALCPSETQPKCD